MRTPHLSLLVLLLIAYPALAANSNGGPLITTTISRTFQGLAPRQVHLINQLRPWFDEVSQKIKCQRKFGDVEKSAVKCLAKDETLLCTFSLSDNCNIVQLKLAKPSTSTELNSRICELIRGLSPLSYPPNSLPIEGGVFVEFFVHEQSLEVALQPKLEVGVFPLKEKSTK